MSTTISDAAALRSIAADLMKARRYVRSAEVAVKQDQEMPPC